MKKTKRKLDLLVLSDVHLGTYGCRAKELLNYLKTVDPKILVLNGDIIDIWQFNKRYFPKSHMKVIKYISSMLSKGKKVYYVTGNHDEMLRKFKGFQLGGFEIVNKLVLELHGKKVWIFHGDVFDVTMQHSKWLAKLGGWGYDILILINTFANWLSASFGQGRISLSKKIKNGVKQAVSFINDFEKTAAEIGIAQGFDFVVCGHIHHPQMKTIGDTDDKKIIYLNSGDWVENLTALEYKKGRWTIYEYSEDLVAQDETQHEEDLNREVELSKAGFKNKQLFEELVQEFQFVQIDHGTGRAS